MKNKVWSFCKTYGMHLLMTFVLLFLAAGLPFEAYYERQFTPTELEIWEEAAGITYLTKEDSPVLITDGGAGYTGIVAKTGNVTLQKGTYTLQVVSLSEGRKNYVEVYSSRKFHENNTQGELLAQEWIRPDGDITTVTFTVEESMEDVSFRFGYGGEGELNVSGFYLMSSKAMYTDQLVLVGSVLLLSLFLLIWKMRGRKLEKDDKTALFVLTAAVVFASLPLSFDFVLWGHDLYYHFNRILGIQEALKSGQFPVQIHSTLLHGYGYGSSIFYPELFLYFPALLGCMGVSLIHCYKVLLIFINGATAWISYRSFSALTKSKKMGLLGAVFYTLSVYRLIDLYTRAAIGEALAMIFLPLVIWGMYELFLGDTGKWYLAVFGFTGIMQSHVLTTELTLIFGLIFGVCCIKHLKEKGRISALLLAAGCTILLNLPLMLRLLQHAAYPFRVFAEDNTLSSWTVALPKLFDFMVANPIQVTHPGIQNGGEMPLSLGFVMLIGSLVFVYVWLRREKRDMLMHRTLFVLGLAVLGIYLSTNLFPWDKIQNVAFLYRIVTTIQLPWRFLALASALLSWVCAVGFFYFSEEREVRRLICTGACILAFLCAGVYINRYSEESVDSYTVQNQYQRGQSQVDTLYFMDVPHANGYRIWNRDDTFVPAEGVEVSDCSRGEDLKAGFSYTCTTGLTDDQRWVEVPFTYYPNYKAYTSEGRELRTDVGEQGVLRVYLPKEDTGKIEVTYQEPVYSLISRGAAILCFLGIILWKSHILPPNKFRRWQYDKIGLHSNQLSVQQGEELL